MVFELHREELDISPPTEAPETPSVACPRCESEVPSSIYCVACGCPMETGAPAEENAESSELRFDLTPLMEMQAEGEPGADEVHAGPRFAAVESIVQGNNVDLGPMEKESPIMAPSFETLEPLAPEDRIEAPDMGPREEGEPGGPDPEIEELANELLNSAYLELWSVGLLRKEGTDEEQFLRTFDAYHTRVERCLSQRDHMLDQIKDLVAYEVKAREARIELDELDIRKSLGDLHEGEYEAKAPALKWTIGHFEAENEVRRGRIELLEDPFGLMPPGKVEEASTLAAEALKLVKENETSAKLSPETVAKVEASLEMIDGLLKRTPQLAPADIK